MEPRYDSPAVLTTLSCFLDPRFKDQYLQDIEVTIRSIKEECIQSTHYLNQSSTLAAAEHSAEVTELPPPKRLKGLAAVLKCITEEEGISDVQPTLNHW